MHRIYNSITATILGLSLFACAPNETKTVSSANPTASKHLASYPLRRHFKCLPDNAALLAAHRGTSRGRGLAENAKLGLEALIKNGTLIAEIDIAKTKDGTHLLFHDGVWDDESTGRGAIASTTWQPVSYTHLTLPTILLV